MVIFMYPQDNKETGNCWRGKSPSSIASGFTIAVISRDFKHSAKMSCIKITHYRGQIYALAQFYQSISVYQCHSMFYPEYQFWVTRKNAVSKND